MVLIFFHPLFIFLKNYYLYIFLSAHILNIFTAKENVESISYTPALMTIKSGNHSTGFGLSWTKGSLLLEINSNHRKCAFQFFLTGKELKKEKYKEGRLFFFLALTCKFFTFGMAQSLFAVMSSLNLWVSLVVFCSVHLTTVTSKFIDNQQCNYVVLDLVYATDTCLERTNYGLVYSDQFKCENGNVTLYRWYTSGCRGVPSLTKKVDEYSKEFNVEPAGVVWKCNGTASPSQCSAFFRVYDVPPTDVTCSGNEYSDYAVGVNFCVNLGYNQSILFNCSNNELDINYFNGSSCSHFYHFERFTSNCEPDRNGVYTKLEIRCAASSYFSFSFLLFSLLFLHLVYS
ncbi:hypothetical protein RFI_32988 [Reticulomyxa filosa]|uniref:Uncharacterized protein n=1 Tax=Reticulomyxa filosa TaxID=46433 RepID=X6LST4_RETFI|nr:hypothetical protein RFI_32988 [Reticulomyxa filosa]|eukprot:ETO04411.1 hypothetical protein RFI_32988 [Reticulomyxa filosa]